MRVTALWRYPVKSMQGESLAALDLVAHGVEGDRSFGVLDVGSGTVVSAKRDGRLLEASARLGEDGLRVRLPGRGDLGPGRELDASLESWLGRPARLIRSSEHGPATYEAQSDFERDNSETVQWDGPDGSFVDSSPVHVLTTADLTELTRERPELQWDVRRFRPNVVVEADDVTLTRLAVGDRFAVGPVELEVKKPCSRCVMTTRPQPGGLVRQLDVLRHVSSVHDNNVGLLATVVRPGRIRLGDVVATDGPT